MLRAARPRRRSAASHLGRDAYVYVRQSTQAQVMMNTESLARQYELAGRAEQLGWHAAQVVTIDADLGQSGARSDGRPGFRELVADVGPGEGRDRAGDRGVPAGP